MRYECNIINGLRGVVVSGGNGSRCEYALRVYSQPIYRRPNDKGRIRKNANKTFQLHYGGASNTVHKLPRFDKNSVYVLVTFTHDEAPNLNEINAIKCTHKQTNLRHYLQSIKL